MSIKVLPYHNLAGSKYQSLDMINTLPLNTPRDAEILNAEKILASYGLIVKN